MIARVLVPLASITLLLAGGCSDTTTAPPSRAASAISSHDAGGNSEAAFACQQGGYETLFRADNTGFDNTGDCVSYAAQGGTLMRRVRFSNIQLGGCNANTFGYAVGGVQTDLLSKPFICADTYFTRPDVTVPVPLGQTALVYLRDNTCGWTFFENGPHGIVTGTNPFLVRLGDGGGFCELSPAVNIWLTNTDRPGNLNVTKTIL